MTQQDDLELLEAWREGDERAGNALFGRHFDSIYQFFRRRLDQDVEDLVQQTFLACVHNRDGFRGDATFRTYLFRVAKTKLYDLLRKRKRRGVDVSMCSMAELRTSPSTWVARQQELQLLHVALERLPLELQLALELFYFEGQSAREVALVLELAEGTVRSRIRRALESLRTSIEELAVEKAEERSALDHLLHAMVDAQPSDATDG